MATLNYSVVSFVSFMHIGGGGGGVKAKTTESVVLQLIFI